MGNVHHLEIATSTASDDQRTAARRRVLMRASMRLPGRLDEWRLTVKDISSTGMKATSVVSIFPGTSLEIELPNIGWIPGEVVWVESDNVIGIRFGVIIESEKTQVRVSGTYGVAPPPSIQLRRV